MSTPAAICLAIPETPAPTRDTRPNRGPHASTGGVELVGKGTVTYNWRTVPLGKMALIFGPSGSVIEAYGPGAPISPNNLKRSLVAYYNACQLRSILNR